MPSSARSAGRRFHQRNKQSHPAVQLVVFTPFSKLLEVSPLDFFITTVIGLPTFGLFVDPPLNVFGIEERLKFEA